MKAGVGRGGPAENVIGKFEIYQNYNLSEFFRCDKTNTREREREREIWLQLMLRIS